MMPIRYPVNTFSYNTYAPRPKPAPSGRSIEPYCPEGKPGCDCGWPYTPASPAPPDAKGLDD